MSGKRVYLGLVAVIAVGLVMLGFRSGIAGQTGRLGTASAEQNEAAVKSPAKASAPVTAAPSKPEASAVSAPASVSPSASAFAPAALENAQLQANLNWTFGGKTQRGWRLYLPLISATISTDKDCETGDFAHALSLWQKERGIGAHGVLDDGTWSRMISIWQADRIKDRAYPSPEELVTAPSSMFFDPSRPEELRKVERRAYDAYTRMVAAAASDPSLELGVTEGGDLAPSEKYFKIISAHRSREYQDQLRKQSPNSGRAGLAVNSPHFTGRALDIYVGGEPVSTKDENRAIQVRTKAYLWLVKNAARFGFRPYFYEPWHWEYVGTK
ncbi:MAG TPA: D-alanyl-D-alanine carboxypeptidase family protein [Blastocatellia bacterium]|nr:D-alanyl-D-alanine carboxypeptidase family protein [Blastocatellia bacterium]